MKKAEIYASKIYKHLSLFTLAITPLIHKKFKDQFLSILVGAISLLIYLLNSDYVVNKISMPNLAIEFQKTVEEINVTKEQFDKTIGKILEKEYYNLSNSASVVPLQIAEADILPILDELRESTGNSNNIDVTKSRNRIIHSKLASYIYEIKRELKTLYDENNSSNILNSLDEYDRSNIESLKPEKLTKLLNKFMHIDSVKSSCKSYEAAYDEIETFDNDL